MLYQVSTMQHRCDERLIWWYTLAKFVDLSGQRFGRLTVIKRGEEYTDSNGSHRFKYLCLCDCGNYITVRPCHLKSGATRSCGCLHKESAAKQGIANTRHGGNRRNAPYEEKRLYAIWSGMRQRCENPNCTKYPNWGGRGIAVCDEWHDFAKFQDWAVSNGYDKELSIDRIDVNGNYQPDNCRWVTSVVQMNNQRANRRIEVSGETRTIAEWSRLVGIKQGTIASRIDNLGWSPEMAVCTPLKRQHK